MKDVSNAVAYALFIPDLMKAGREVGYAIAVHGSMARDLDIVAIPWTEEAVNAERLIMHLMAAVDGRLRNGGRRLENGEWESAKASEPTTKPQGRKVWVIHIGHEGLYLDVSVMPLMDATAKLVSDIVEESPVALAEIPVTPMVTPIEKPAENAPPSADSSGVGAEIVAWLIGLEGMRENTVSVSSDAREVATMIARRGVYEGVADDIKRKWPALFTRPEQEKKT